jgi:hypothetical protein
LGCDDIVKANRGSNPCRHHAIVAPAWKDSFSRSRRLGHSLVAKANPADAPDQKAPTGGVSTANLSNQWAEERQVESGRIEIRRELISEIRDEISGTL